MKVVIVGGVAGGATTAARLKRLNENRHYVHKSQDFTKLEDFQKALSELRSVEYFGDIIHIDATNFFYQNDNNIWLKITDFIEKC